MGTHVSISGHEAADRLEIRQLVDAYAHCADRRDAKGQMSLFTKDTHFVVFMDARSDKPSTELTRREDLAPIFEELNKYEATTHFIGQSTVVLDGDRATGETYCIAHHVSASEGKRTLFIASLRYVSDGQGLREAGGADVILATSNSYKAAADTLRGLRPDGRLMFIGASDEPFTIPSPGEFLMNRHQIIGSSQNGREYLYEALDYVAKGKVKVMAETAHPS